MPEPAGDLIDEYRSYLQRFEEKVGPCEFGAYAKYRGKLIKKLRYDEFEPRWKELQQVDKAYTDIMSRGDTINDVILKVLRDRATELVLERELV